MTPRRPCKTGHKSRTSSEDERGSRGRCWPTHEQHLPRPSHDLRSARRSCFTCASVPTPLFSSCSAAPASHQHRTRGCPTAFGRSTRFRTRPHLASVRVELSARSRLARSAWGVWRRRRGWAAAGRRTCSCMQRGGQASGMSAVSVHKTRFSLSNCMIKCASLYSSGSSVSKCSMAWVNAVRASSRACSAEFMFSK